MVVGYLNKDIELWAYTWAQNSHRFLYLATMSALTSSSEKKHTHMAYIDLSPTDPQVSHLLLNFVWTG
jgi:hypothetical protein